MEHHYRDRRTVARLPQRAPPQSPSARFVTVALGAGFTLFGAGLGWLVVGGLQRAATTFVAATLAGTLAAFIGLFGFSMALQAARGRPTAQGFFARWLMRAADRTSPFHVFLTAAVVGTIGLLIGTLFDRREDSHDAERLLLGLLAFHLQVFFHEYGHWLAARSCGYRPFRVIGGAFGFSRKADGLWAIHRNRDWRFLIGGAVFYAPAAQVRTWSRDMWTVLAGPLATLLLFEICRELAPVVAQHGVASRFIAANMGLALLALIVNLWPARIGLMDLDTDGYRILELLRNRR